MVIRQWRDPEEEPWRERWRRRGELMFAVGITASATWLSASLPTQSTTHVDIWPPLVIFAILAIVGGYVIVAAESGHLWLPDRKKFEAESERRFNEQIFDVFDEPSARITQAINGLTEAVSRLAPSPPDEETKP